MKQLTLDTGEPRNVTGHVVSGAFASGALSSAMNYHRYQKGELNKREAIRNSVKLTVQGGMVTGSAIAAANYVGKGNLFGALTALSLGAMGVYATEKVNERFEALEEGEPAEQTVSVEAEVSEMCETKKEDV